MIGKRPEVLHDAWVCFSDILLVLVCSVLFLGAVTRRREEGTVRLEAVRQSLTRQEEQVTQAEKELLAAYQDLDVARTLGEIYEAGRREQWLRKVIP